MEFNLEVPLGCEVSFGQVSVNILYEMFKRGLNPAIFPIHPNVNLSPFDKLPKEFHQWLGTNINNRLVKYSRNNPSFRLWHIQSSESSVSKNCNLFTFFELNKISEHEKGILSNQNKVFVSSKYTQQVFKNSGIESIYVPLGFDSLSFSKIEKRALPENIISWGIFGKYEGMRKRHDKIIKAWVKRFGNDKNHVLHASISNPFLKPDDFNALINNCLEGKKYFNINFIPHTPTNSGYNTVLNATDIHIACSGGEGMDLPFFQNLCLQKHGICLNAHVYKDYTNKDTVTYVEPSGMIDCIDNIFFHPNQPFNCGQIFDFKEEDLLNAFDIALAKYKTNPINKAAEGLKDKYTWEKTVDGILNSLGS